MSEANNSPIEQTTDADKNKKKSAFKYILIGALLPILALLIYWAVHFKSNNTNFSIQSSDTVSYINISGAWFLQPMNRAIALSLASVKGEITLNIVDSTYCNVIFKQSIGNVLLSRKYKIQDLKLTFNDPVADRKVTYIIDSLISNTDYFILKDASGNELFKVWSYKVAGDKLSSQNIFQKNAFLYPTLSPQEQVSGSHRVVEQDGKINITKSPDKAASDTVNIYKMF